MTRLPLFPFGLLLCVVLPARATLYQFNLEGTITYVFPGQGVNIDDPVKIRFVADSTDRDPRPDSGMFDALPIELVLPTRTLTAAYTTPSRFDVRLFGSSSDIIQYQTTIRDPFISWNLLLDIVFRFPDGTLTDALPLSLPLGIAEGNRFSVSAFSPNDMYRGVVTSYTSVQVPDPTSVVGAPLCAGLLMRTRRRQ